MTKSAGELAAGRVWLAGAGPGDPGLITVRAAEVLGQADQVLYDGLVNPLLLRLARGRCERTSRIRREGAAIVPQEEINRRLIEAARQGLNVVRLKGGDPCIFGRGGEEAEALRQAGIAFEIIPGITAATAAAEYAGISFTDRHASSAVAFVTAHEDPLREGSRLCFRALAQFPGTLVFYMGLNRVSELCLRLQEHGLAGETAAAVICRATLPSQQLVTGTLGTLPDLVAAAGLQPPSLVVVGDCVQQRRGLSWYEQLPLFGLSIGVPRAEDQASGVLEQIVRGGGEPVPMPLLAIEPIGEAEAERVRGRLADLTGVDWLIFTSGNGVREFFRHLRLAGRDVRALGGVRVACVGSSTAASLAERGVVADLVPEKFRAESLVEALAGQVSGRRVVWVRGSRGRDVLPVQLSAAGAEVEQLVVYRNEDAAGLSAEVLERVRGGRLDWICLSSPAMARRLAELLREAGLWPLPGTTRLATISQLTTAAAAESGLEVAAEAVESTWQGLLAALHFVNSSSNSA